MALTLDHVFILTEPGAPVAERLIEIGLVEGNSRRHSGQGTENRVFSLPGFAIELLFIANSEEALNGAGRGLGLQPRYVDGDASPCGYVVRADSPEDLDNIDCWNYYPDYFKDDMYFQVGGNSKLLAEPLCVCMPLNLPRAPVKEASINADWRLTGCRLQCPVNSPSKVLLDFTAQDKTVVEAGKPHHVELVFNDARKGKSAHLAPQLPLTLRW